MNHRIISLSDRISVIVPAYNLVSSISRCLDSILAQSYENLEIIAVDDGSTDESAAIIDAYAARDSRVKAIHKENGGVTSARLAGVAAATGEWIGFVDGDDFIEPDMYQRLLENARRHHADISHCGCRMVFPDGRTDFYYNTGKTILQEGLQGCKDLISGEFVEPGLVTKLYRRTLFSGLETWMDRSIRINEDLLMNYYLFKAAGRAVHEDFCPYHYILRRNSASTASLNEHKLRDPLRVTRILMADAPEALEPFVFRKLVRLLINGASMDAAPNPALIRPYRAETRRELRCRIKQILSGSQCGAKLKLMALCAGICPAGYRWLHALYAKITGLDKKYHLD